MTPASEGTSNEQRAIQAQIDAIVAAWNRHDTKAMSLLYTEDADAMNPFGRVAKSRAEIERLYRDEHTGPLKDSRLSLQPEGVRLLTSDVAVADHSFEVSGARDQSGNTTTIRGRLTTVLKKVGGGWQIAVSRPMIPAPRP